jgi:hypothetical protein
MTKIKSTLVYNLIISLVKNDLYIGDGFIHFTCQYLVKCEVLRAEKVKVNRFIQLLFLVVLISLYGTLQSIFTLITL